MIIDFNILEDNNVDIRQYWKEYWDLYRTDIMALTDSQINDEDALGVSCKQYRIMQYYLGFYLVVMIYLEMIATKINTWSYYVNKYDLKNKKYNLGCNNISLDKILEIFGLPTVVGSGIEHMNIEGVFIVEPSEALIGNNEIVDMDNLIYCNTNFDSL